MRSIAEALVGEKESNNDDTEFDMDRELERQAEYRLQADCMAEIDRYKRMDEWSSSFHNLYTRTAIDCQYRLMKAGVLDMDIALFIPYTRVGTFDLLRLDAFRILLDLNIARHTDILRWLLYAMSVDSSAYIRRELYRIFGISLASLAFGREENAAETSPHRLLVIEQESSTEARKARLARKQTVPGALDALKQDLGGNIDLKEALWAACNSPYIGLHELHDLLYICTVLYEPIDQMMVSLKYPKYWKTEHLGSVS